MYDGIQTRPMAHLLHYRTDESIYQCRSLATVFTDQAVLCLLLFIRYRNIVGISEAVRKTYLARQPLLAILMTAQSL